MAHTTRHMTEQSAERRRLAIAGAREACGALEKLGVTARVIGSLAGNRFGPRSDVDFLILDCPRGLKYSIEGTIEDSLGGLPFDVVYLDEIPAHKLDRFTKGAVAARDVALPRREHHQ